MAKQLNILSPGQVIPTALHSEVQQSYLEYAMSVIVGRALPDVRDGLKPVHRRILYAMHELGLTPDRPYRKCARVVGDVLGKYHPHGDQSVYDALVRMVQDFSSRYPVLAGHGNFGSIDNDPPAAMRYTETRLAAIGNEVLLDEIGEATVDFIDNFDSSQQEPVVLPAQLPILLLNGSSGIAVGMATNVPPHNLGEVVDGLIALIDRPTLSDEKLHALIPGPDFPTGGEIIGRKGIEEAYTTGRGSIPVRSVTHTEEVQSGRGKRRRMAIIVTEFPFQVNKASCIEKIAALVNQEKIQGIADIRDESDRDGIRVVIELRPNVLPEPVLESLYRQTPLQSNFGAIFLALHGGQPSQLSLRELLQYFLEFRETTLNRQYHHELDQAQERIHILEGLLLALESVDEVIEILRHAADGSTAKLAMQEQLGFSDRQSDAILAMPMRRLTGLERQKLQTEYDELAARVATLQTLLTDRKELLKVLKKDLRGLKRKFGDERRTRIISESERAEEKARLAEVKAEAAANEEDVILEFTHQGYVRRSSQKAFQRRQAKQDDATDTWVDIEDDVVVQTQAAPTSQELLVFTRDGKVYGTSVNHIPVTTRHTKGTPLITLLPPAVQADMGADAIATYLPKPKDGPLPDLLLLTQQGRIKRIPLSEFDKMSNRGITALKVKDDDVLAQVWLAHEGDQVVAATSAGRLIRFPVDDDQMPIMGRTAQGNLVMRLSKHETFVGGVVTSSNDAEILLVTAQGYAKRMLAMSLKLGTRGSIGSQAIAFHNKTDRLTALTLVPDNMPLTVFSHGDRMTQKSPIAAPLQGRDDRGNRWLKLPSKDTVWKVAIADLPLSSVDA
ncbi:MAG: DNA gyrase subunit A [Cyanothece sp. SIO2G6]|nr:DNA gyrase subunit A [Cyanothece sp. SIO2G6]